MFNNGYQVYNLVTHPVLVCSYKQDNKFEITLGAFTILNKDGWFVTSATIVASMLGLPEIANTHGYDQRKYIIWGKNDYKVSGFRIFPLSNLAFGIIENFDSSKYTAYPCLGLYREMKPNMNIYKYGFSSYNLLKNFDLDKQLITRQDILSQMSTLSEVLEFGYYLGKCVCTGGYNYKYEAEYLVADFLQIDNICEACPVFDENGILLGIHLKENDLPDSFLPENLLNNHFKNKVFSLISYPDAMIAFLNDNGISYHK